MLSNSSPNPLPGKAYEKPSKFAIENAMAGSSTDAETNSNMPADRESFDSSSEMVEKHFDDLSNPQGYMLFSPF